jgi:hypothetical protein
MHKVHLRLNTTLVHEGRRNDVLYIVLSGSVKWIRLARLPVATATTSFLLQQPSAHGEPPIDKPMSCKSSCRTVSMEIASGSVGTIIMDGMENFRAHYTPKDLARFSVAVSSSGAEAFPSPVPPRLANLVAKSATPPRAPKAKPRCGTIRECA